jgi:hypothetical protein
VAVGVAGLFGGRVAVGVAGLFGGRVPRRWFLGLAFGGVGALLPLVPVFEMVGPVRTRLARTSRSGLALSDGGQNTYLSAPIDLGLAATSVAAHWVQDHAPGGRARLAVRTSRDGVGWDGWQELEGEGSVPAAGKLRVFGTLARADGARYAQYRLTLSAPPSAPFAVHTVELFGIDSGSAIRRGTRLRLVRPSALAAIKPLGIVSRKQWGADESLRFGASEGQVRGEIWPEEVTTVEKVVVHHTAGPNVCSSTDPFCQRRSVVAINDIYHYHTVTNGWGDIGYNSLIGYDGRIYEGRHGPEPMGSSDPISTAVVAGHALGHNRRSHGIALMGNFEQEPVPDHQYDALQRMLGWIVRSQLTGGRTVDPTGASDYTPASGQTRRALPNVVGHRDVYETECPGEHLYARLDDLRVHAKRMLEWPPVRVTLRARPSGGGTVTYHVVVDNHEPTLVRRMTVKGAVPANAEYVDSWAGQPGNHRGAWDGSVVTWVDPEAQVRPGADRREYAFVVRPRPGVNRGAIETTAWAEFAEPARGVAMSDRVRADVPVEVVADVAGLDRETAPLGWGVSTNVGGYHNTGYLYHDAGDGQGVYTWHARLPEAGTYEVAAWWTAADDRATNAPYTVHASDGVHTVRVNQREGGAAWVRLGEFPFAAGSVRVTLRDDADGVVVADAVRFRQRR